MWIIGLTGSMGAGKTTLSRAFRRLGVPVHCADEEIHALFNENKGIQKKVGEFWPEVFVEGHIDRHKLRRRVLSSPHAMMCLEEILYPKLVRNQKRFLQRYQRLKAPYVVLDVPLLFEIGMDRYCHYVIVVAASKRLRQQRVLQREGLSLGHFQELEARHFPSHEKEKWADIVIQTGREKGSVLNKVKHVLEDLSKKPAPHWSGRWPHHLRREIYGQRNRFRYGNNWI